MRFQDKIAIVTGGASGMGKDMFRRAGPPSPRRPGHRQWSRYPPKPKRRPSDHPRKRAVGYVGNVALPAASMRPW